MNNKIKIFFLLGALTAPLAIEAMSLGQVRNLRDGQFTPALNDAKANGVTVTNLSNACNAIQTPGIMGYANYFTEFYRPFVQTFGAAPETVCNLLGSSIQTVQTAINGALPTRGGSTTVATEQAALQAVQNYLKNGGSPQLFLNDTNALISALMVGAGGGAVNAVAANMDPSVLQVATNLQPFYTQALASNGAVTLANLVQCSADLKSFLQNPSSAAPASLGSWAQTLMNGLKNGGGASSGSAGKDPNVVQIAQALVQSGSNDTFLGNNDSEVTNLTGLAAKVASLNNPTDDLKNPTSAFGMIDKQIATYTGYTDESLRYNQQVSISGWAGNIVGALQDVNDGYACLATYTTGGAAAIPGFVYDVANGDYLNTIIPNLVSAAEANGGGTSGDGLTMTDPNLVAIATALSGINGEPESKDSYIVVDSATNTTSVDPSQLSAMAKFATDLRSAMDRWQGDQNDPADAADPSLCFVGRPFADYVESMNSAVADETDILELLPDLFRDMATALGDGVTLEYNPKDLPSKNIYGHVDADGQTVINKEGLFWVMQNLINGTPASGTSYTLDNADSLASLATLLADQIANHNSAVAYIAGRAGAVKKAFTDATTTSSSISFLDGKTYAVSGATGSATTRCIAQEVFHDVVNSDQNGMISLLNNQALLLLQQAQALTSAGAASPFTTSDGTEISSVSSFGSSSSVSIGTSGPGTCTVTTTSSTF
jgi:hypothetical protein